MARYGAAMLFFLLLAWGCSPAPRYTSTPERREGGTVQAPAPAQALPEKPAAGTVFRGVASYYADKYHGRKTANGETFDMHGLTAAHTTLAFDTWLEVRNLANNKTVIVRVNDRGPFVEGRIIDLSYGAAKELDMLRAGIQEVECTVIR